MTTFRRRETIQFIDPTTGEQRIGKYYGINKDGTLWIVDGRNGKYHDIAADYVTKCSPEAKRERQRIMALINRSARTDLSVMANPNMQIVK